LTAIFRSTSKCGEWDESTRGCREPVGLFLRAGVVVLQVKIQRAVRIRLTCVPSAERIAVERVCHEEVIRVMHGQRPEAVDWRELPLREVHNVSVCARVRLAVGISLRSRIDGILRRIRAQSDCRDQGDLKVVCSVESSLGGEWPLIDIFPGILESGKIFSKLTLGASFSTACIEGFSRAKSNGAAGLMRSLAIFAMMGASAAAGGLSLIKVASRLK